MSPGFNPTKRSAGRERGDAHHTREEQQHCARTWTDGAGLPVQQAAATETRQKKKDSQSVFLAQRQTSSRNTEQTGTNNIATGENLSIVGGTGVKTGLGEAKTAFLIENSMTGCLLQTH